MARRGSPGNLRHLVSIKTATNASDGRGGSTQTPSTQTTAWARIEPLSGRELMQLGALSSTVTHRVTIRYQSGILPKMTITWGSRTFQISSVRTVDEELRWTVLDCFEEFT